MAMQLFGAEADSVAKAAEYVASLGCADILDFNMGCPAPKVVKNHEGSAMLKNPENAYRVLKALVGAVDMPVTVKLRIGWDKDSINIMEMAQLAQEGRLPLPFMAGPGSSFTGTRLTGRLLAGCVKACGFL